MSEAERTPPPEQATAKPKRHRWDKASDYRKRCKDCGMHALRRPHPYGRRWWTEWTLGERNWNTLQGDKTPPCQPTDADGQPQHAATDE
ncbi:hypothetical protein [Streptomyces sp. IBSBF 2950]|uniref:hypothetical protein n=1 Tax=Streptomyces sp. IBSBF 2950 TaxID=2903528 RepID=UPI002FDC1548